MSYPQSICAVIFDCDGVMFDSRQANINFYNHLLARYGLKPLTKEQTTYVHMHTADKSVRHIFEGSLYTEEAQAYRLQMDYAPFIKDMVIEPGLKQLLEDLKPRMRLAIATNRSNTIREVLEQSGLGPFFDMVVSSLDVENPKPHPESIEKILDFFELSPDQAVYIGDSLVDLETAQASGVLFIAYGDGALDTPLKAQSMMAVKELLAELEKYPPHLR